jgi:hypothetical protein
VRVRSCAFTIVIICAQSIEVATRRTVKKDGHGYAPQYLTRTPVSSPHHSLAVAGAVRRPPPRPLQSQWRMRMGGRAQG